MLAWALLPLVIAGQVQPLNGETVKRSVAIYNAHAREKIPTLEQKHLKALLKGEVVGIFQTAKGNKNGGVVGLKISSYSRDLLWFCIRDPHFGAAKSVQETNLASHAYLDSDNWYQFLDLPWPFGSRHWYILVQNNVPLAVASHNQSWERYWNLVEDGEAKAKRAIAKGRVPGRSLDDLEDSIYVTSNHGAWFVIALPGGKTLLGFQVTTVAGGVIPDELVARYSLMRMDDLLTGMEQRAVGVEGHYLKGHEVILGGDGEPLPFCDNAAPGECFRSPVPYLQAQK